MPSRIPEGAMCVQRFDDSRNSAIHITCRISLRSSSMPEPRDPLLKVLVIFFDSQTNWFYNTYLGSLADTGPRFIVSNLTKILQRSLVTGPPKQSGTEYKGWEIGLW